MGSSMGGLISFYAALEHQDVFSKAGVFSPSFWFNTDSLESFIINSPKQFDMKFHFLMGGQEGQVAEQAVLDAEAGLLANGFGATETFTTFPPNGDHSENFWKSEFARCLSMALLEQNSFWNKR